MKMKYADVAAALAAKKQEVAVAQAQLMAMKFERDALRSVVDSARVAGQARFMTEAVVRIALLENKVTAYYGNNCNIEILKRAKEFVDLVHGAEPKV